MCTLEEIVELDLEGMDAKQFEQIFDQNVGGFIGCEEKKPISSKTPYSDVTQVSDTPSSHQAATRFCAAFCITIKMPQMDKYYLRLNLFLFADQEAQSKPHKATNERIHEVVTAGEKKDH